jgi:hypothetical protein
MSAHPARMGAELWRRHRACDRARVLRARPMVRERGDCVAAQYRAAEDRASIDANRGQSWPSRDRYSHGYVGPSSPTAPPEPEPRSGTCGDPCPGGPLWPFRDLPDRSDTTIHARTQAQTGSNGPDSCHNGLGRNVSPSEAVPRSPRSTAATVGSTAQRYAGPAAPTHRIRRRTCGINRRSVVRRSR